MAERRDKKNRLLWKGEYQKADGRYMYKYIDVKGNSRFVYSWTLTQTDRPPKDKSAGKCLRELEKEIEKDLQDSIDTFNANKTTLNSYYEDYIEQKQELKASTRSSYRYFYKKYIWDSLGKMKLSNIKFSDVKKFYNHMIYEVGFKPYSIKKIHGILHPIFSTAVRDGYIRVNPADGVIAEIKKSYDWEKPRRHALSVQEQEAFIEYTKSHRVYKRWLPVFTVLLGTGCRVGEIIGLTWEDCDFKNIIISINHSLIHFPDEVTNKSECHITSPKTKSGERVIPMFSAVRDVLLKEKDRQMREGYNGLVIDGYSGFIFSSMNNGVLLPEYINRAINSIVRNYNAEESKKAPEQNREPLLLPHFSVHNLRHTFCTRLCENEPNIKIIQEIMGHSDIATTMDVYNEASLDKKKESFSSLEGKLKIC